jgi:hypothetical protein
VEGARVPGAAALQLRMRTVTFMTVPRLSPGASERAASGPGRSALHEDSGDSRRAVWARICRPCVAVGRRVPASMHAVRGLRPRGTKRAERAVRLEVRAVAIEGSCLCGGVRFEIERAVGPFEVCHCRRCRKRSGAAALPMVGVRAADYRLLAGRELVRSFEAPILYGPPSYRSTFCSRCGSPVPPVEPAGEWLEIPAGLFDGDPGIRPDKHIFVELVPDWDEIADALPQLTLPELARARGRELPPSFRMRRHGGSDGRGEPER